MLIIGTAFSFKGSSQEVKSDEKTKELGIQVSSLTGGFNLNYKFGNYMSPWRISGGVGLSANQTYKDLQDYDIMNQ